MRRCCKDVCLLVYLKVWYGYAASSGSSLGALVHMVLSLHFFPLNLSARLGIVLEGRDGSFSRKKFHICIIDSLVTNF